MRVLSIILCFFLISPSLSTERIKAAETVELTAVYKGLPINENDRAVNLFGDADASVRNQLLQKYNQEYYLYSQFGYGGQATGTVVQEGFDRYYQIDFPEDTVSQYPLAITQNNTIYPRDIQIITTNLPDSFSQKGKAICAINDEFDVHTVAREVMVVDLDGDEKTEYLIVAEDKDNSFITKCLFDADFNIVAYLMVLHERSDSFNYFSEQYSLEKSGIVADINQDNIYEIINDIPQYEGFSFEVTQYINGIYTGAFKNICEISPFHENIEVILKRNNETKYLQFDISPINIQGSVFVPIRDIAEYLGYEIIWNAETSAVTISGEGKALVLMEGRTDALTDEGCIFLPGEPLIIHDKMMVPIRIVMEFFGYYVSWESDLSGEYVVISDNESAV